MGRSPIIVCALGPFEFSFRAAELIRRTLGLYKAFAVYFCSDRFGRDRSVSWAAEVIRRALEIVPGLPVLLITGFTQRASAGPWPTLAKPFRRAELEEAIGLLRREEARAPDVEVRPTAEARIGDGNGAYVWSWPPLPKKSAGPAMHITAN